MKINTKTWIIISCLILSGATAGILIGIIKIKTYPFAELLIDDDEDLIQYPGNGSMENPYIIENLRINTKKMIGIEITGVTLCFELRNCIVNADWIALKISNVTSAECSILNSSFSASDLGIHAGRINSIIIKNNTIQSEKGGMVSRLTNQILIENNFISGHFYTGLEISSIEQGLIKNNTMKGIYGMSISHSTLNVCANTFLDSGLFIGQLKWIHHQGKINCSYNAFKNTFLPYYSGLVGISFDDYFDFDNLHDSSFINNTIDGNLLIFLTHTSNQTYSNIHLGQLTLIKCYNISLNEISMIYTDPDTKEMNFSEVEIKHCSGITITNCTFTNFYGMLFESCSNILVNSTRFTEARTAINIENGMDYCITFCYFSNNINRAITLDETFNSTIHHNSFMDTDSAYDKNGDNNVWYDTYTIKGNYWIDYDGNPAGYFIPGSSGSIDLYPLLEPPI